MLQRGGAAAWVHPVTVHELSHALPRVRPDTMRRRDDVLAYLGPILALDAVHVPDKGAMLLALRRWASGGGRFADALLAALAEGRDMPVCSVNARHFPGVPNTYLDGVK